MTDPLALDPVLPLPLRSERPWNEEDLSHDERFALAHGFVFAMVGPFHRSCRAKSARATRRNRVAHCSKLCN